jgi:adenine-specific DNA-methyltransferase
MDIFYLFFHIGLDLLKDNGVLSYITTNYFTTATAGTKLRLDFKMRSDVLELINFGELKVFKSAAGQHNMITILQKKTKNISNVVAKTSITKNTGYIGESIVKDILQQKDKNTEYFQIPQESLYDKNGYIKLTAGEIDTVLDKMLQVSIYDLNNICDINQGILSGADTLTNKHVEKFGNLGEKGDGIFVLNLKNSRDKKVFDNIPESERNIVKPFYKNSDILKYALFKKSEKYIIYITKQTKIEAYPVLKNHLEKFKLILQEKRETRNGKLPWYSLHWSRNQNIFESQKVVCSRRASSNIFGFEINKMYEHSRNNYIRNSSNFNHCGVIFSTA